ncbi:MAG: GTPase Era [Alphaproteobacteria bacterium]|nr:GTPase Era [Alphaproteobacteria bacterium]
MSEQPSNTSATPDAGETRCGFIAIIGAPNAGKSTLVNQLVGTKITIVSRKVQTTRMPVRGIVMAGNAQLILIDTPGIFEPRRRLDRAMVGAAWGGTDDADAIVFLIDAARGLDDDTRRILAKLKTSRTKTIVAFNKVDRVADKAALLPIAKELTEELQPHDVHFISALDGDGVDGLKQTLAGLVPPGPWHYPEDDVTDLPLRLLAAELTREKIYNRLHQELPYAITVETTDWKELRNKSVRIEQTVYVERESQKKIVIGKNGSSIKQVSSETRAELSDIIGQPVHLFLFVKVRENWADDPARYREMGLEFPKG